MVRRGLSLLLLRLLGICCPPGAAAWDPWKHSPDGGPLELTTDTFEELILKPGQHAFVKYYAPKNAQSKKLRSKWHRVGMAYNDTEVVLVGDVNCKAEESKQLCYNEGIRYYPTIKYFADFTGMVGEEYREKRELKDMVDFIRDYLYKYCDPTTKDLCDDEEKAWLDKQAGKDTEKLQAELDRLVGLLANEKTKDMSANKRWIFKRIKMLETMLGKTSQASVSTLDWVLFRSKARFFRLFEGLVGIWFYFLEVMHDISGPVGPAVHEWWKEMLKITTLSKDMIPDNMKRGLMGNTFEL
jgi:hypothetical protein